MAGRTAKRQSPSGRLCGGNYFRDRVERPARRGAAAVDARAATWLLPRALRPTPAWP